MGLVLVTAPAAEPVTLAEAKAHLRVTTTGEDTLITALIVAARRQVENLTRRALISQVWDYKRRAFPGWVLELPLPPLISVGSINYLESAAGANTLLAASEYRVQGVNQHNPGRITPEFSKVWPSTYDVDEAVTIRFTAGWADAAAVPEELKVAMKLMLTAWFEHRAEYSPEQITASSMPTPSAMQSILRPYMVDYF